jgi:hypothetical protein
MQAPDGGQTDMARYKTGEECPKTGRYRFDGYTDGTSTPQPTTDEMVIPLSKGENFPPIRSQNKACWRKEA